jgi:hypothetical protein
MGDIVIQCLAASSFNQLFLILIGETTATEEQNSEESKGKFHLLGNDMYDNTGIAHDFIYTTLDHKVISMMRFL